MRLPGLSTAKHLVGTCTPRVRALGGPIANVTRRQRRSWSDGGRAHIEARGVDRPGTERVRRSLEQRLGDVAGVNRAEVNPVLGRVVVDFDADRVKVEDLLPLIEEVERARGADAEGFRTDRPEHPGDLEPIVRNAVAIGYDLAGLGLAVFGRALRITPIPVVVPWLLSLLDSTSRPRERRRAGGPAADLALAAATAAAQGLAQGEVALLLDAALRTSLLTEAQARREAWRRREVELTAGGGHTAPVARRARPVPIPPGPAGRYAVGAALAAAGAGGGTLWLTRDPRRAFAVVVAGSTKAARLGREGFAAQLGRAAARRGVVVLDPAALRRLDRVDVTVLDPAVLLTGRHLVEEVRPLADGTDPVELYERVHELVDRGRLDTRRERGGWGVQPARISELPPVVAGQVRALARRGATVLLVTHGGAPVGLATAVPELDPLAEELVAAARRAGRVVLAGPTRPLRGRLPVDDVVAGGSRLAGSVRRLQQAGHVVALVSARGHPALAAADCGIGIVGRSARTPWEADLLCGPGLADAWLVLEAVSVARGVSHRGVLLSSAGSATAALLAVGGPARGAARRALLAVNGAAIVGLTAGTWSGLTLARRPVPLPTDRTPWHALPAAAALRRLRSSRRGSTTRRSACAARPGRTRQRWTVTGG